MKINNKTKTIGLEILGLTLISILSFSIASDIYGQRSTVNEYYNPKTFKDLFGDEADLNQFIASPQHVGCFTPSDLSCRVIMELDYMSNSSMVLSVFMTDKMGLPLEIIKNFTGFEIDQMSFDPNEDKLVVYLTK